MTFLSKTLEETEKIAEDFLKALNSKKTAKATLVCLTGDLGAGKTAFSQAVGKILGITDFITSPTFVLMKNYPVSHPLFSKFIHIDAYRLNSGQELAVLGFKDLLQNPANLIFLEWPERVADILPLDALNIKFKFISDTEREIIF